MLLDASRSRDRPDHVYLSDFGLAKASLAVSGLTSTGQFLGTLDYVAPEQVEGRPVDGRTDQYALACVAFELLTGDPPFRRADGMAVMYAQVSEPPPLLSSRRPGLPAGFDAIIDRALAKSPADRHPSCREFAADLRRALRSAPPSRPLRSPTQVVRRPAAARPAPPRWLRLWALRPGPALGALPSRTPAGRCRLAPTPPAKPHAAADATAATGVDTPAADGAPPAYGAPPG